MQTEEMPVKSNNSQVLLVINIVSIAVPVVVALLLGIRSKFDLGDWTGSLPHLIGGINSLTTLVLVAAWVAIKQRKYRLHGTLMTTAIVLGAIFLVCYVTYHLSNPSTAYGGGGLLRSVYYFTLISHIGLSLIVLPLVLRSFAFAITKQFERHQRIARYALPIWLYVSATGVMVYMMIRPYYQH